VPLPVVRLLIACRSGFLSSVKSSSSVTVRSKLIAAFQSRIQKRNRGRFLFAEDPADAWTLVDQNADGERFFVLLAEALYVLFAAVLFEREIVWLEAGNESSGSISDCERHIDEIDVYSKRSLRGLLQYCRSNDHQYRRAQHECPV
jgi:hypothetical protein